MERLYSNAAASDSRGQCPDGKAKIAYFSMEIGIDESIPSYSGGLGILAGDTIKSCADLSVPVVAVTLLSENGYFHQKIDDNGNQIELPIQFNVSKFLKLLPAETTVSIDNREVRIRAWLYQHKGINNYVVPVFFLDSNIEGNTEWDRSLTRFLYGGDEKYRLGQEIILGIGGVRMLKELGYNTIERYHMNEGHAALGTLELYSHLDDVEKVREKCVFTTHTPVAAGHDQFDLSFAKPMIGEILPDSILSDVTLGNKLNMTMLALFFSHYINGVAKKHGEISRTMFPGYSIDSITNGIHTATWVSEPFQRVFDKHMPEWRSDPFILRSAFSIGKQEIWNAHIEAKKEIINFVNITCNAGMNNEDLTIGFARRQTAYKRPDLLISDTARLSEIVKKSGPIQIIYAGKAHPNDYLGKESIKKICDTIKTMQDIKIVYIPNYEITIGKMMVSGVDVWLNTPRRPNEASGTSGMKAACNGVPQFGTLDGWWIEGCIENITGWSIGPGHIQEQESSDDLVDSNDLYDKLENAILPKFYSDRDNWIRMMRSCIAINGSFFNTNRMVQQYVLNAYFR